MGLFLFKPREPWRGDIYNKRYHDLLLKMHQKDFEEYRKGYPNKEDDPNLNDNFLFYTNQIPSRPEGDYIDNILTQWRGDYNKLEAHHGYIQWLFPLRERGYNREAQELQGHEAEAIRNNPEASARVLKAYFMMLNFYGIKPITEKEGILERAPNFEERFAALRESTHNFLRITRILKSLGELGHERYKFGFVSFLFEEVMCNRTLFDGIESLHDYWIPSLKEIRQRKYFYEHFKYRVKHEPDNYDRREKAVKKREEQEKAKQLLQQEKENQENQEKESGGGDTLVEERAKIC